MLAADKLAGDPRVAEAKRLLAEAVEDAKRGIVAVQPANAALADSYKDVVDAFGAMRSTPLWYPYIGSGLGNGCLVELADGSIKYDMICGVGPQYFGHSHPLILNAAIDAALEDVIMQGNLQPNKSSLELCQLLTELSGFDHCFLSTSGAMANENGLKLIFYKKQPAYRLLAFERCFAGRTLTTVQITDKALYRKGLPNNLFVDYLPFFDEKDPDGSTSRALEALHNYLHRYPGQHAALCLELVQGEGGFYPGSHDFFVAILEEARKAGVAIFVDEVQTFARMPELFAFQYFGLQGLIDVVSIGKVSQACATLFRQDYKPYVGLLSQTFTASSSAIKASIACIKASIAGNFFGRDGKINHIHDKFVQGFQSLEKKMPDRICGPYGIGSMIAFTPMGGQREAVIFFSHALFDAGVINFTTGTHPMRIRLLPPVGVITDDDIDAILSIIEATLQRT